MSVGGKMLSRASKQDTKSLHETETSMKHFISKGYSGLKDIFLRTHIFESQNGQHIC